MKKLFAIALVMNLMFSGCSARTETVSSDTNTQSSDSQFSMTDSVETKETEDGTLTLGLMENMSSWEDLANTALSTSDNDSTNTEDFYCKMLIKSINKRSTAPAYNNEEYISCSVGGICIKEIDSTRLMQKYQKIIDIYNTSNNLQLVWETKSLSEDYMQVDVKSTNITQGLNSL